MAKKQRPPFRIWVEDYLADTGHLSFAEHGCYLRLLFLMWLSSDGTIPNDIKWIQRKLSSRDAHENEIVKGIVSEFCKPLKNNSRLTQKKLKRELAYAKKISTINSDAAKSRWEKEKMVYDRNAPNPIPSHRDGLDSHDETVHSGKVSGKTGITDTRSGGSDSEYGQDGKGTVTARTAKITDDDRDRARGAAPGYDVYALEKLWRDWSQGPLKDPARSFIGFCRSHAKRNRLP